jgi:hypothetical protein
MHSNNVERTYSLARECKLGSRVWKPQTETRGGKIVILHTATCYASMIRTRKRRYFKTPPGCLSKKILVSFIFRKNG